MLNVDLRRFLGDEVYQMIEKCGCAGNCYRMDHMETVLDYSEVTIKDGTNTTDVRPVIRVRNIRMIKLIRIRSRINAAEVILRVCRSFYE